MTSLPNRPHPGDVLSLAFETINARGTEYDNVSDIERNFREAAAVASVLLGKEMHARDLAIVQIVIKLIRSKSSPEKLDNYVDMANYAAFAACFAGLVPLPSGVKPATGLKDPKPQRPANPVPEREQPKEPLKEVV